MSPAPDLEPASKTGARIWWVAPPWRWKWPRSWLRETPLLMTLLLWLCALPAVLLLTIPFLGVKAGLTIAAGLLVAMLLVCLGLCSSEDLSADGTRRRKP